MDNNLSQLHDIHLPPSIGWWPLAPGWYMSAAILLIICCVIVFFCKRYYVNNAPKREALRTLALYQQQYRKDADSQLCSARISELLKRVALVYYPRTRVAGLQGEAWLVFLNSTVKGVNFNPVRTQLLELPWQPARAQNLQLLFETARKWISRQGRPCLN